MQNNCDICKRWELWEIMLIRQPEKLIICFDCQEKIKAEEPMWLINWEWRVLYKIWEWEINTTERLRELWIEWITII